MMNDDEPPLRLVHRSHFIAHRSHSHPSAAALRVCWRPAFSLGTGHAAGNRIMARVPCPWWLSRRMFPPLHSTHRRALGNPIPRRLPAGRELKNGSNARFSVCSSIPQPLSFTLTTTRDENESYAAWIAISPLLSSVA